MREQHASGGDRRQSIPLRVQWVSPALSRTGALYLRVAAVHFPVPAGTLSEESAKTWICPADNLLESVEGGTRGLYRELNSGISDIYYSYALNYDEPLSHNLLYPGTDTYFNPGLGMKVRQSANFMFLHETGENAAQEFNSLPGSFRFNHRRNTAMNVLFMDGHIETVAASEMLPTSQWTSSLRAFWFGQDTAASQMLF